MRLTACRRKLWSEPGRLVPSCRRAGLVVLGQLHPPALATHVAVAGQRFEHAHALLKIGNEALYGFFERFVAPLACLKTP